MMMRLSTCTRSCEHVGDYEHAVALDKEAEAAKTSGGLIDLKIRGSE